MKQGNNKPAGFKYASNLKPGQNAGPTSFTATTEFERFEFQKGFDEFTAGHPEVSGLRATVVAAPGKALAEDLWKKQVAGVSRARVKGTGRDKSVILWPHPDYLHKWDATEVGASGGGDFGCHDTIESALNCAIAFLDRLGGGEIIVYWKLTQ